MEHRDSVIVYPVLDKRENYAGCFHSLSNSQLSNIVGNEAHVYGPSFQLTISKETINLSRGTFNHTNNNNCCLARNSRSRALNFEKLINSLWLDLK